MARYPQTVLVSCPVPWDASYAVIDDLFREEVRLVLAAGFRDIYVFGTGGEGYAVDTPRFEHVVGLLVHRGVPLVWITARWDWVGRNLMEPVSPSYLVDLLKPVEICPA